MLAGVQFGCQLPLLQPPICRSGNSSQVVLVPGCSDFPSFAALGPCLKTWQTTPKEKSRFLRMSVRSGRLITPTRGCIQKHVGKLFDFRTTLPLLQCGCKHTPWRCHCHRSLYASYNRTRNKEYNTCKAKSCLLCSSFSARKNITSLCFMTTCVCVCVCVCVCILPRFSSRTTELQQPSPALVHALFPTNDTPQQSSY